jgi:anti-anti-sigma regulatory factor
MITPVQLGCSTLVRVQGELTETSAGQAISSLLHVLDQAPHAVLIDLALLTGLDHAGAGAITVAARCSPDTPITLIDPRGRDRALLEGTRQPIAYGLEAALAPHCTP